jgi:uncharacterized protein YfaS (alpha-2-macroglobulin family)
MSRSPANEPPPKDDPLWKAFDEAMSEGRPQTALERLAPIEARAAASGDDAERILVIATRIDLEVATSDVPPGTHLKKMRVAIDAAEPSMRPVMEAIQASWMWDFFQQHRWQFSSRTAVAQPTQDGDPDELAEPVPGPDDDLLTWDLPRILRAIDDQFQRSIQLSEPLKSIPIDQYRPLVSMGNVPTAYRPTMFDVLLHHAIEFYSAGEQAGSRASNAFDLSADSPIFGAVSEFLDWKPETPDQRAPHLRAVRLYQQLLRFHEDDQDPTAFLDTDLARYRFGNNHAVGPEKSARFESALKRFVADHGSHPISAQAQAILAQSLMESNDFPAAHRLASEGLARYPESVGGKQCYNLIQQIEAKEAQTTTERVWADPWPTIDVRYRNVNKIYFRLIRFEFADFLKSQRWQPEGMDQEQYRRLLKAAPVKAWSADLPKTTDYRTRTESLPVPQDLQLGSYFLISSHREDFAETDNQLSIAEVWVSKLSLVVRVNSTDGILSGHVLDSSSGQPIAGATVQAWQHDQPNRSRKQLPVVETDREGEFRFPAENRGRILLLASHGKDQLSSANFFSTRIRPTKVQINQRTQFFTDRSIYRPGQTIRYKGICFSYEQENDQYHVLPKQDLTVVLMDAGGQEVERLEHRSNDYGSFSGSFTAPRGRLTGAMTLRVLNGPGGQATVRVEEYKRPKFEVELLPPESAARLGEMVELSGQASAYTGNNVQSAGVQWRVVREVRYPPWWYWRSWWLPPAGGQSQEIARGFTQTGDDGKFEIQFEAKPDRSVSPEAQPTFHFTIHADVTDGTGETRSAKRSINVGYTALAATISAQNWLTAADPIALSIRTTSLDGDGQAAEGVLKIHSLQPPEQVQRRQLIPRNPSPIEPLAGQEPPADLSNVAEWPLGEVVQETGFQTDAAGNQQLSINLPAGVYRAVLTTRDRFGKEVKAESLLEVFDLDQRHWSVKLPHRLKFENTVLQPGQSLRALWASGYPDAKCFVEIEHRGKMIKRYWTEDNRTQSLIELPITEEMRGGLTVHTTMVRENRVYLESQRIDVPWSNKQLDVTWERFVSKLGPAQQETWTAVIQGKDAERAAAEMVATLYDASLDAFALHQWISGFGVFRQDFSRLDRNFANQAKPLQTFHYGWTRDARDVRWQYPFLDFPRGSMNRFSWGLGRGRSGMLSRGAPGQPSRLGVEPMMAADSAPMALGALPAEGEAAGRFGQVEEASKTLEDSPESPEQPTAPDSSADVSLEGISVRTNLNETAFFFPHVTSGEDGVVRLQFTMPEALTRWRFMGFAHDANLRAGLLSDTAVTSKDLMIQPNAPRFLREGDTVEMTVKVTNLSPTRQTGQAALNFFDPRSNNSLDEALSNTAGKLAFDIPAGGTQSLAWRIQVPDSIALLTYRAVASSGRLSDGEEGYLPVLSRRILIHESLPLPIRGKQTKEFTFQRLLEAGQSETLQHQSLTVQMASNPAWYAVMSLPYLMEFPHQCSEQIFNRLYANALARHIATSDPKIERVFEQWRATKALDSPLMKNQELRSVLLEESPWVQQAQSESQARRNVGILFDQNRLQDETARALDELAARQLADGRWAWFPDGPPSDFITLYITTGFGRLRHLGVPIDTSAAIRSLESLDQWMAEQHRRALEAMERVKTPADQQPGNFLGSTIALYLYGRSFFIDEHPVAAQQQASLQFWLDQARRHWLKLGSLQSQAHLAIALKRFGDSKTADQIMVSLKERSLSSEEMGIYWRPAEQFYWWYHAPIETQAILIEAMDEVAQDAEMVEGCKVWLLKQKQTQDWKTTKATADAVYALLLRGTDLLASNRLVEVTLGGELVQPDAVEAGTGFYQQRLSGSQVEPELGRIQVTKHDEGVAWGSVHWQYFQDIDQVTAHTDTPLKLSKELYVKRNTDAGPKLIRVSDEEGPADVRVGDELVVRLVLRVDRDLEYVHLKDHRGSGTEPVNVLSGYRYRDGLGYYESTKDTASHFFIDYLRRGTYVFEYSTRVQLRGNYQTGLASIQCMYAPEFSSHSQSIRLDVAE